MKIRTPRWITSLCFCVAAGILVWLIFMAQTIPKFQSTNHYDIAWIGFDIIEFVFVILAGIFGVKHSRYASIFTALAALLFFIDGWFDIWTSSHEGMLDAVYLALFFELPLVIIFISATVHLERIKTKFFNNSLRS